MQKVLGDLKKGLLFIISSPSGAGKTTLVRKLMKEFDCVIESVSSTTRGLREGEKEEIDYFFLDKTDFENKIKQGFFLEYAKVFDYYYGTSKEFVNKYLNLGKHVILVIDTQGAMKLKNEIDAIFIFISPPSIAELKKRMDKRDQDSKKEIEKRLKCAEKEIEQIKNYDYNVVNIDLETAYQILKAIFIAEEHKIKNLGELN